MASHRRRLQHSSAPFFTIMNTQVYCRQPPGVTPNIESPADNMAKLWLATIIVCIAFPSVFSALRFYIKICITRCSTCESI